jgi:murein DD-endopeptidase MepM/ murein hydrolase activator NlpD
VSSRGHAEKETRRTTWACLLACLGALALGALATSACSRSDSTKLELEQHAAVVTEVLAPVLEEPAPELKKVVPEPPPVPPWTPKAPTFSWVFEVDHGIRNDEGGKGAFLMPRAHGRHNGVDFLAAKGEKLLAACSGKARSDKRGGYGNVVQLVCKLPDAYGGDEGLHVSFFYAHLDKTSVPKGWTAVKAGDKVGTVGKSGNASGPKIKPHLHLEVIVRGSEEDALAEKHSGVVREATEAADRFFELLGENCLTPARFSSAREIRRERRVDPFTLLLCTAKPKPELTVPSSNDLAAAQIRWSEVYKAQGFDVDRGPR